MKHNVITHTIHGPMIVNRNDLYLGRSFIEYGEFLQGEIELLCALLNPGDLAIDCGANIGDTTLPLAKAVGKSGQVLAFEPAPFIFQMLCGNLAVNSLTNAEAYNNGVGNEKAFLVCAVGDPSKPDNFTAHRLTRQAVGHVTEVVLLDEWKLEECALLKIDVEGMELDVLKGAAQTIERCRPFIYFEAEKEGEAYDCLKFIEQFGYDHRLVEIPFYRENNWKQNPVNIFGDMVSSNILCTPKGKTNG